MPKRLEEALKREADKRGYTGERRDRYIYGGLRNIEKKEESSEEHKDNGR